MIINYQEAKKIAVSFLSQIRLAEDKVIKEFVKYGKN